MTFPLETVLRDGFLWTRRRRPEGEAMIRIILYRDKMYTVREWPQLVIERVSDNRMMEA